MLRAELKDSDIPHRTTLRNRILERLNEHFEKLKQEMAVCQVFTSVLSFEILTHPYIFYLLDEVLREDLIHHGSLE